MSNFSNVNRKESVTTFSAVSAILEGFPCRHGVVIETLSVDHLHLDTGTSGASYQVVIVSEAANYLLQLRPRAWKMDPTEGEFGVLEWDSQLNWKSL